MNQNKGGHSEAYFGNYRDYWWNEDFLELIANRLNLNQMHKVLDVGFGHGHWSKKLIPYLGSPLKLTGVDKESKYTQSTITNFKESFDNVDSFEVIQSDVSELPFESGSFDMVTCQTLLIHVPDPERALKEMIRVLKPGGLLLCVEPNNGIQALIQTSLSRQDSLEARLDHVKYAMIVEEGKKKLGRGDSSFGDLLPGVINRMGLQNIHVYQSDKAIPLYPPYKKQEQRAALDQWDDAGMQQQEGLSDLTYFEAMGTKYLDFYKSYHIKYSFADARQSYALQHGEFHSSGGVLLYLVSGIKP
ncbi:class I SAM-dependent methyltransferase [Mangrovivirga cuniculi]|uniref:Class I SAM-dependent methyltransferase n=1 Tax=Mangrovivirga cuniculi TaxID=2715131 RepID=A0A4D7JL57_9BACT|nr:class I SAM-dependent methyltransferase [Mangrovivirga cuniculi]QCK14240.1 class I SAM-dependent methyltransferase [Mangrovivirga cuniculi]